MNKILNKLQINLFRRVTGNYTSLHTSMIHCEENGQVTEKTIKEILEKRFPKAKCVKVEDISGGCGAMFNIFIESEDFKGVSIPKQHRAVYDTLKDQIKSIHGLHLETKIPT